MHIDPVATVKRKSTIKKIINIDYSYNYVYGHTYHYAYYIYISFDIHRYHDS